MRAGNRRHSTSVSLYNERQKVEVKLYKDLEKDELFQIGTVVRF